MDYNKRKCSSKRFYWIQIKFSNIFNKQGEKFSDRCENLTSIQGIGTKNCNKFYETGYTTRESIISASDEELLTKLGVGVSGLALLKS